MKIAIIGCGTIANGQHIPAYLKNEKAEIKYFCDIILEKAQKAVEKYGCGIAVADYKEVLADSEVEAISICTPNNMHSVIAIDALKAGKLDDELTDVLRKVCRKNIRRSTRNAEGSARNR